MEHGAWGQEAKKRRGRVGDGSTEYIVVLQGIGNKRKSKTACPLSPGPRSPIIYTDFELVKMGVPH